MGDKSNKVVLTGDMKYGEVKTLIASAWPRLPIIIYRPTVEHYKEGRPTAEDLELSTGDELCGTPGREAVLHGGMTGQDLHNAVMRAFDLETEITGVGIRGIWRTKLDET
ncbi:hypothetical protein [Limnoglobus roseus]|uniref:Uncharacterized protein n=1 Tax=Limnoglobus roseus TaxID=2598579 RepID=A0A5C1AQB8_9BACT|nr:hypothetical protein [Limnoglobus roseus]QEL19374.1 hypothetical protein PX52LOC_06445 [Limnoglobus roseus]